MENNNSYWYENNSGSGAPQYNGYYSAPVPQEKKRKAVTWPALIACLLAVTLISGGMGAGIFYLVSRDDGSAVGTEASIAANEPSAQSASSEQPAESVPQGDSDVGSASPGKASSGIVVSSAIGGIAADNSLATAMSSVVGIDILGEASTSYFGMAHDEGSGETTLGSGSGVILTSDGYIVTNNHVVSGAEKIKVYLQDGSEYEAELIGMDDYSDLAVIKINASGLPAATIAASASTTVGDTVYAIGNPLGVLASSVSKGIISGLDRVVEIDGYEMVLTQTDAAVNPGNSGGGLFNEAGELIGVVNSKASGTDVEGLGFAIPIDTATPIVTDLMDYGFVTGRPYLGVGTKDIILMSDRSGWYGSSYTTRAQIASVFEGGAADLAGIEAGDILIAIDGKEVSSTSELTAILYAHSIGDTVTLTVQRGETTKDFDVILGERHG